MRRAINEDRRARGARRTNIRSARDSRRRQGSRLRHATIQDAAGLTVPGSHNRLTFTVSGPRRIVATDNGDPTSFEPFTSPAREAFNGLALVIVRPNRGATGTIRVMAAADGLGRGTADVRVVAARQ